MNSYHLLISEEAYVDVKEARAYYNSVQNGLGAKFRQDLSATLQKIRSNPNIFGFKYDQFRSATLRVFPYQVHYMVEGKNILVFAVLYSGRKPSVITSRAKQ